MSMVPTNVEQSAEDAFKCERDAYERMEKVLSKEILRQDEELKRWKIVAQRLRVFAESYSSHPKRNPDDKLSEVLQEHDSLLTGDFVPCGCARR